MPREPTDNEVLQQVNKSAKRFAKEKLAKLRKVNFHKDYSPEEFDYKAIEGAWQPINGLHRENRYLFIGQLTTPLTSGEYMAYLRRPDEESNDLIDVPFNYRGFREIASAEEAIFQRASGLDWRLQKMNIEFLPVTA